MVGVPTLVVAHAPAGFPAISARTSGSGSWWGSSDHLAARGGVSWGRDRGVVVSGRAPADSAPEAQAGGDALLWAARPLAAPCTPGPRRSRQAAGTVPFSHVLPSDPGESGPSSRTSSRSLEDEAEGSTGEA
ncbi:hypothetical protein ACRRTK_006369 [Alexandromys fortis]